MQQDYRVASGIIIDSGRIVFVQNRRKNGRLDWSTPGGVVDPGESVLQALRREVVEETALAVDSWSPMLYSVDVDFVGRDLSLRAEIYGANSYVGELHVDDPDQVVVDGRWVDLTEVGALLDRSPQWVAEPLGHALNGLRTAPADIDTRGSQSPFSPLTNPPAWRYDVTGSPGRFRTHLRSGPDG